MHIQHVTLMVNDLEESIKFYETITELTVSRRFKAGAGELAFLTNGKGETEIELVCMPQGQKFEGKGMFICFKTDKLDEMHNLVQDRGLNPSAIQSLVMELAIFMYMIQMGYQYSYEFFQSNFQKYLAYCSI